MIRPDKPGKAASAAKNRDPILLYAEYIIDAPDEWTPQFTRSELLPMARAYVASAKPHDSEFTRPSDEDERRALGWLMDVRENGGPLERRFARTIIETLAYFEQEVPVDTRI